MKDLQNAFVDEPVISSKLNINKENLLKYLILFIVVTVSTLVIPTCGVLKEQAVFVGLIASTTFAVIDMVYPNNTYINDYHTF